MIAQSQEELLLENERLQLEVEGLRRRLEEAEETIDAIRGGEIDAVFIDGGREAVLTLESVDRPYRLLVEQMTEAAATLTLDGEILYCNRHFADHIGRPVDQVLGKLIVDFAAPDSRAKVQALLTEGRTEFARGDVDLQHASGGHRKIHLGVTALHEGAFGVCLMVTDLSEQVHYQELQRTQQVLQSSAERLRLLWEAAGVLLSTDDPDAMLRQLFMKIGPHIGADAYFNFLVGSGGDVLVLNSYHGVSDEIARGFAALPFGEAICGTVAIERRPIYATHIQDSDDPKVALAKSLGIRAYACNPLISEGRLIGTLSFASRARDEYEPGEVTFLETLCKYVTVAYERLRLLNELKEADRRKDEFLATLAHELRNPLAPIRNAVESLRIKGMPEWSGQYERDVIDRQVSHLTRLIDDLLDVSRITRNKLELRKQPIELSDVVDSALEMSLPIIEQAGHRLVVDLPEEPVWLEGDAARLAQVFMNLLNNAAKYTAPSGQIWLNAKRENNHVLISVKDTGSGIPAEKLPQLFQIFYQADRSLERAHGGLGIGLSLVRRFVEMHGGVVSAYSDGVGRGSEFVVRLPVLARHAVRPSPATGSRLTKAQVSRRILVVDDNQDSAKMLATVLRLTGHQVDIAYDGLAALETGREIRPEVILLDIGMPRLNGYDACRRIREEAWGKDILLIAQTGWGQNEDRKRTAEAGFDAHCVKPVSFEELNRILNEWQPRESQK